MNALNNTIIEIDLITFMEYLTHQMQTYTCECAYTSFSGTHGICTKITC